MNLGRFANKLCNKHSYNLNRVTCYYSKNNQENNNNEKKNRRFYTKLGICSASSGVLIGYFVHKYLSNDLDQTKFNLMPTLSAWTAKNLKGRRREFNFIADVVNVVSPSVVYIEIKDKRHDFRTGQAASNGSGFIVDSDGLILTNAHVVLNKPSTDVHVKLLDGRMFQGIIEDVDHSSDLATIRIQCKNLPTMTLGESSSLQSGEWVIALGSPLALSNTVTAGVVSSIQRPSKELGLKGRNINYIQTDAAITFGNSGGPLVNLDGEAIGINSMKVTPGISFAIPVDYAKEFLKKGAEKRKMGLQSPDNKNCRRYMGITMLTLTEDIIQELVQRRHAIPQELKHGVLVWKVILGSPAHVGGLSPGDIVTHINSKPVNNSSDIYDALAEKVNDLNMTIYRGHQRMSIIVKPEDP